MSDTTKEAGNGSKRTYHGSCVCRRVRFEADIDLSQGTGKCNCTSCWKRRWWSVKVRPADFRALGGEEELSKYRPGAASGHGGHCKHCGVTPYGFVDAAEWNDGEYVSVNVACLDDLEPADLLAAPILFMDGRNDDWWHPPAETRHL
ncbi:GFA family protein [Nannocystis sp. ILAH1]|uniref:GFA family protein n=1 Tax=Nannocystis sp. ILAH1 TaxID=2996789 RepID=UPI00226F2C97|nr:GFA family protein [Nannocystis sp. ILAH1]MCY0989898.1 GFA family protein [Nannocystis sp. ILAH1]